MARIQPVNHADAQGKTKDLLDTVKQKMGKVPNIMATMANSPATLEAYLTLSGILGNASLSQQLREQIALTVGQANECDYCLAAHTAIGKMSGLSDEQAADARRATADDPKAAAALAFASAIIDRQGFVTDDDLQAVRAAGYQDGEVLDILTTVVLNIFTNYFNHVAQTEVDFPAAPNLAAQPA